MDKNSKPNPNRSRRVIWFAVAMMALIAIVTTEIARRANTHDYSSRRTSIQWPARLTLDRSDLARYLRYQFNVEVRSDAEREDKIVIRAGWCQLAGRHSAEPSDVLAAEAALLIAQQPWFEDFVASERGELRRLRTVGSLSTEELRERFVEDLAATDAFRSDFPKFIGEAADKRDVDVQWLSDKG